MDLKNKDFRKIQAMAEQTFKKMQDLRDYLETYADDNAGLDILPRVHITTTNIFKVQDALGGEIKYVPFWGDRYYEGQLQVGGVVYVQYSLTRKMIDERKGAFDL